MRIIFPVFIIFTILFFTMNSATTDTLAVSSLTSEDADISVLQPDISIKEPSSQEYVDLQELATETTIPAIKNASNARFQASVRNMGSEDIWLKTFRIRLFNETGEVQTFEKNYPEETLAREILSTRQIKTERTEGTVSFPDMEITYHFMFTFVYVLTSNVSNLLEVHYNEKNTTVAVFQPNPAPPFFILWGIGFFSGILVLMCALGYYGNRKKKIAELETAKN